jgi:hypothetical protein
MIRLLTCEAGDAKLKFEEFDPDDVPSYAILSHTWLDKHEGEVSYHDLKSGQGLYKPGWTKSTSVLSKPYRMALVISG